MQVRMKCSVAVHCLIFIHEAKGVAKVTSTLLAESTGCNPVVIRNILSALKKAGLITVPRGTGGAEPCADPTEITLYQIYAALEPAGGNLPHRDSSLSGTTLPGGTKDPPGAADTLP